MISEQQFLQELHLIITNGIREDVGPGDYSALACIADDACGRAKLLVKDKGIIAGVAFAQLIFAQVDQALVCQTFIADGQPVAPGDVVFEVAGPTRAILRAERLVLNAMQRMSAIATKTNAYVQLLTGSSTKILDTRKTTPGFRAAEKWAVAIGGGENHRFALYDMIMLKDNHIDFCGGLGPAIRKTKQYLIKQGLDLKIIVEARNLEEVEEILHEGGVHRILLDNFDFAHTKLAVNLINKRVQTESSGNINEKTIRGYADCGVDYISCGALTHSVKNMDLSLKAF